MSTITDYPILIRLKAFVSVCGLVFSCHANAQEILIHSHNDYRQRLPFYQAYAQQLASIEADIYTTDKKDELLVAHDQAELGTALRPAGFAIRQQ